MFKYGQLLTIGIAGKTLSKEETDFIINNDIGGVILFTRNIESKEQLIELTKQIQSCHSHQLSKSLITISIDMEGGRVHRLKPPFKQWPAIKALGDANSPQGAFDFAHEMGLELASYGINMNYAPCLDVLTNPQNVLIGDRSISSDPETVARIGSAMIRGYLKAEVMPVGKHYPGHGETVIDSHDDLPVEDALLDRLMEIELVPFVKAFKAKLPLLMTAHMKFPNVDADNPVTFSSLFLKDILRDKLNYRGFVMSDDLDMKALTNHYERTEIPVKALHAGCDLLLYCNDFTSPPIAIESINKALESGELHHQDLDDKKHRWLDFKSKWQEGT